MNPFLKIYKEVEIQTILEIRKILENKAIRDKPTLTNVGKIYTGGLEPEEELKWKNDII